MVMVAAWYAGSEIAGQRMMPGPQTVGFALWAEAQSGALLTPSPCSGSWLVLTPNTPPTSFLTDTFEVERGVFVTAIKPLQICSLPRISEASRCRGIAYPSCAPLRPVFETRYVESLNSHFSTQADLPRTRRRRRGSGNFAVNELGFARCEDGV